MNKREIKLHVFLLSIVKPYKRYLALLAIIGLYWGIFQSAAPYVLKIIIDKAVSFNGERHTLISELKPWALLYLSIWCFMAFFMRLLDWTKLKFFPSVRFDAVHILYRYLNQHSYQYFQNNFAGSLANKVSDLQGSVVSILTIIDDSYAQIIGLCLAFIAMFLVHPIFALIFFLWVLAFIGIALLCFKNIKNLSHLFALSKTLVIGKIVDGVTNITNIRLFARASYENEEIDKGMLKTIGDDRNMQYYILKMRVFWDISMIALIAGEFYLLITMYAKGDVTVGDFSFILSLSMTMFFCLWYLASQFVTFAEEVGKCNQALSILSHPHDIVDIKNARELKVLEGMITFDSVYFSYGNGKQLFHDKSIVINPREKVGLVGLSGSGKSSFVNLILRLFEPQSGCIKIDGQDISKVTQSSLRENISIIEQSPSLFHRSLLENIRYGNLTSSFEEVVEASKKANCHEFISDLTEGYDSLVGERGIKLSGGQRQRVAIARAFLKKSPILILDEATSSLDSITESLIQKSLNELMRNKTVIIVAHRLSTLAKMDRLLVFDSGQIIEDGCHQQLLDKKGHYFNLWNKQIGGFIPD